MIKADDSLQQYSHYEQTVDYTIHDDGYSAEIFSNDVTIISSSGNHNHGSSKVKLKNIVDFSWEHSLYVGNLLAIHISGKYFAYGIKVAKSSSGVVRVVNKELEHRILLRLRGPVHDLAFAHVSKAILACVDCFGSLFVYTIDALPEELTYSLILQVNAEDVAPIDHRVIWCPYIPDEDTTDGDEVSKLLVLTRGSTVELWSVAAASKLWNKPVEIKDPEVKNSGVVLEIKEHTDVIVQATLSPDGTALATASRDGEIKFFQVFMLSHGAQQRPRCLHQWRPHGGRPISSLFFLDDHKNYQPDAQFWRYAITGCDHNSELKLWSCEVWTCLQTIKFSPHITPCPVLKAGLDLSAGYLLLSDIYNRLLYILNIAKDSGEVGACVNAVSEFLLPSPMLSFAIVDAGQRKIKPTGESLEDLCPGDEEDEDHLVIRMYLVQPKSLQECHIAFRTATHAGGNRLMDTLTHDSLDYNEDLREIRGANHNGIVEVNNEEDRSVSAAIEAATNHAAALNLMTPDAFSSPAKKESALDSNSNSPELGNVLSASPSLAQAVHALNTSEPPLATSEVEDQAPPSGGSSPSREVREILSLAEPEEGEGETKDDIDDLPTNEDPNWPDISMALLKDVNICSIKEPNEIIMEVPEQINIKDEAKSAMNSEEDLKWRLLNDNKIFALANKFDSILEVVKDQRQELRELRLEVSSLRSETPLGNRVENAVTRATQQQTATVEQTLYKHITRQHEFLGNIEKSIKENIEAALPQVCANAVEPLKSQLRLDSAKMDELLKANLTQMINGTQMKEAIALAAANAAKPTLEILFKETFTNTILPGMEKTCQAMFRQIQDTFVRGTREYLQNVDAVVERHCQKRYDQKNDALVSLVKEEMHTAMTRGLSVLQEGTLRTIRDSMRENLTHHFSEISGVRSRATTPGPPAAGVADIQARILSLLQRGQLNAAFQQALSASDLSLVTLVCEKTDPTRVFSCQGGSQGPRSILQQPVILSLVQQLSADLGHRTELKHRWLEEAILNLDPADPVTREHIGTVLSNLHTQLSHFISTNPNNRSARPMKMLAMATRSLLNEHP